MATKNIMQLTPATAAAMTNLFEIDDGAGSSLRLSAAQLLELVAISTLNVQWTGTLPASFPALINAGNGGIFLVVVSGDNIFIRKPGVFVHGSISFTDVRGLLTSITFTNLGGLADSGSDFVPTNCQNLTTISFPTLFYVGGNFQPGQSGGMAGLTTLSIPVLAYVNGNFSPNTMASLTTLSAPALIKVGSTFGLASMANLGTLNIPNLTTVVGAFSPGSMASLATISAPSLQSVFGIFAPYTMASLTTISFPAMIYYGGTITLNTALANLTTVTLGTPGTLKGVSGAMINISGAKLDAASVNGILALLVSLDGTGGTTLWGAGKTVNLSGGTSAAPSGQGIIDKATLIARTATVTTN